MAKVLLIDADQYSQQLEEMGYDVVNVNTIWNNGTKEIEPDSDVKLVIYWAETNNKSTATHTGNYLKFQSLVEKGAVVICIVGGVETYHIKNLIGGPSSLEVANRGGNLKSINAYAGDYLKIFSLYGGNIIGAPALLNFTVDPQADPKLSEELAIIATLKDNNFPIAFEYKVGDGMYVFLPQFGQNLQEVLSILIKEILPNKLPGIFISDPNDWLKDESYYFPKVLNAYKAKLKNEEDYIKQRDALSNQFNTAWNEEQAEFNKLLVTDGDELKEAVLKFFRYIGYFPIDVDKYWIEIQPERSKEEDLWLTSRRISNIETIKGEKDLKLVEVKGIKNQASDSDTTAISKYVRRRMKEFNNVGVKGILVINHYKQIPANKRNDAYSIKQIEDAKNNGDLLMTTLDLFNLVKVEKEGGLSKQQIVNAINTQTGLFETPVS